MTRSLAAKKTAADPTFAPDSWGGCILGWWFNLCFNVLFSTLFGVTFSVDTDTYYILINIDYIFLRLGMLQCRYGIVITFQGMHFQSLLGSNKSHISTARKGFPAFTSLTCCGKNQGV